jgi:hypothetical protein
VMCVALAYWDHDICEFLIVKVKIGIVLAGAYILFREAVSTLKPILITPDHPPREDNIVLAVGLLAGVVLPTLVLFFAGSAVLAGRCAV